MWEMTGAKAGLSSTEQIEICLRKIVQEGGVAQMSELYDAINRVMADSDAAL